MQYKNSLIEIYVKIKNYGMRCILGKEQTVTECICLREGFSI